MIGLLTKKVFITRTPFLRRCFSTRSQSFDPYTVLGVERNVPFDEIKKQYFKLAAEFHPDRNKAKDAAVRFVEVKEAFELIKQMKGLSVNQNLRSGPSSAAASSAGFESVRPNAEQYRENFDEETIRRDEQMGSTKRDYYEYMNKAPDDAEHESMKESLKTMADIAEIKFRPDDVDLPDPSSKLSESNTLSFTM
eukprot:TRINITY_DN10148_c0_g1_i1.p1 TRINITY_DN10148_c0_g1~~TRINITY_DN10148_c0_g1_i1.p1  ORF type:complete len:194 (+),score=32.41 TRINITY_DN10148_c0_g1_i1:113-694(+)